MGGIFNPLNLAMYTYGHQNSVKFTDPDGNAVFATGKELLAEGTAVTKLKNLQPVKDSEGKLVTSYCNFGVDKIEQKGGGTNDYHGKSANEIIKKLKDETYATKITPEQAVEYAKQGATVIAGKAETGHGHVADVSPEDMVAGGGGMVPKLMNVGSTNGVMKASDAWNYKKGKPDFYITNTDLNTLKERDFSNLPDPTKPPPGIYD
jgi:hypothetical protein